MPATRLDGANDNIICSRGACLPASNAHTWLAIFRQAVSAQWHALAGADDGTTTVLSALEVSNAGRCSASDSANGSENIGTVGPPTDTSIGTNTTNYYMYAYTKAGAGGSTPRHHASNITTPGGVAHVAGTRLGEVMLAHTLVSSSENGPGPMT
jgi:hypothetical protein